MICGDRKRPVTWNGLTTLLHQCALGCSSPSDESSCLQMLFKACVLKNLEILWTPVLEWMTATSLKKDSNTYWEVFKNKLFYRTPPVAAPGINY